MPQTKGDKPDRKRFKAYLIGYFHIDIAEVSIEQGKLRLFVAINRTLKDATVKRFYYESHDELRAHLRLFLNAYNHAHRLKALRGLTPYEAVCRA